MSEDMHGRARRLIDQERVEGILADADRMWLAEHLRGCDACVRAAGETERALAALRSTRIELPRGLARRAQMSVRLRADELHERGAGRKLLWAVSGVSWVLGVASAPWVWRGFAWVGQHAGVPKLVWELGFVLWWAVPALLAAGAVLASRKREWDQEPY
jgi:hypothetical protein